MKPLNINYFKTAMARRKTTQRALAQHMGLDRSAITHRLSGSSKIQLEEIEKLASFFDVPVEDILLNVGLELDLYQNYAGMQDQGEIEVIGTYDGHGLKKEEGEARTVKPYKSVSPHSVAILIEDKSALNGATIFYEPTDSIDPMAIGRFSIITLMSGEMLLAHIGQSHERGKFRITPLGASPFDSVVKSAAQILLINP